VPLQCAPGGRREAAAGEDILPLWFIEEGEDHVFRAAGQH